MRRLLKYEIKQNYLIMIILLGVTLTLWTLFGLYVYLIEDGFFSDNTSSIIMTSISASTIPAGLIVTIVFFIINLDLGFYKKLFTKTGYLTFSLPVKAMPLISSKLLVRFFWAVCFFLVNISGLVCFFWIAFSVNDLLDLFYGPLEIIWFFVTMIFFIAFYILLIFFSACLLNMITLGKVKGLSSFLIFMILLLGITVINQAFSYGSFGITKEFYQLAFGKEYSILSNNENDPIYLIDFTKTILYCSYFAVALIGSKYIIEKKLEIV